MSLFLKILAPLSLIMMMECFPVTGTERFRKNTAPVSEGMIKSTAPGVGSGVVGYTSRVVLEIS